MLHRLIGPVALVLAAWVLSCALAPVARAQQEPPLRVAVFPFQPQREPHQHAWLGRYVQDVLRDALLSGRHAAVMSVHAARGWATRLERLGLSAPDDSAFQALPADVVVQGTTHQVLELVEVRWRLTRRGESPGTVQRERLPLSEQAPPQTAQLLVQAVLGSLVDEPQALRAPPQPDSWDDVRAVYRWAGAPPAADAAARLERLRDLEALPRPRELVARLDGWRAELLLQQAMQDTEAGPARHRILEQALAAADAAVQAQPWQSRWYALKGEVLYFLQRDYEARAEASVGRLKNPQEALAYVVQALAEGLSTGRSAQLMTEALALDPFLERRPGDGSALQGGIVADQVARWRELHDQGPGLTGNQDYEALVQRGKQAFLDERWPAAVDAFQQAMQQGETDYRPRLYLNRIRIQLGQPEQAVQDLRELAAEFPLVTEVRFHLGVALEHSGAYEDAANTFQRLRDEAPEDSRVLFHLGRVALARGRPEAALAPLRELLLREPEHAQGWLQLGVAHAKLEQWEAADEALQQALRLQPDAVPAQQWMARVREHLAP